METETALTEEAAAALTVEAAAVGRQRHRQRNIGTTMTATPATKTSMWVRYRVVVDDGNWYYNNNDDDDVYNIDNHVDDLQKGGGSGGSENRAGSGGRGGKGGRGGSSGNGKGKEQSTKSIKNGGGGNSGGQEVPGKRREAAVPAGVAAAAGAAVAAAMASGERPEVRVEIGVSHTLLGDYLVQSRAMFLANVYLESSQCLASRQTFICAADRFICSRR